MAAFSILRAAAGTVTTGLVGAVALEAVKKMGGPGLGRRSAVVATTWGLRGVRTAEVGAEHARLFGADVLAEARESMGERTAPPETGVHAGHDHEH